VNVVAGGALIYVAVVLVFWAYACVAFGAPRRGEYLFYTALIVAGAFALFGAILFGVHLIVGGW
jgi:hypothetical protein